MNRILKIIIISISMTIIVVFSIIFFVYLNNKKVKEEYFTILESKSYVYEDNREMSFTIYSNKKDSIILYPERNIYKLKIDTYELELENIDFDITKYGDKFIYHMTSNMPSIPTTIHDSNAKLSIINNKYTLNLELGPLSILDNNEYELLSYKDIYGVYSEINNIKYLVGITIELSDDYNYLTSLRVGGFSFGQLEKAIPNIKLPNDINIKETISDYKIDKIVEEYTLALISRTYFIPISYIELAYIKTSYILLDLDGKKYYIDQTPFSFKILDYDIYNDYKKMGELKYD